MSSQVYLNPVGLSILTVPREKVWIFSSSILILLHEASKKTTKNYDDNSGSEDSASDGDEVDFANDSSSEDDENEHMNLSFFSTGSGSKRNLTTKVAESSKFDNSSKNDSVSVTTDTAGDARRSNESETSGQEYDEEDDYFFHVAFSPTECTVICSKERSRRYFDQPLALCKQLGYDDVMMLSESYLSLLIDTEGDFNNSERILELTRPLSAHKISLFFLSSHFTDIVLIPYRLKDQVVRILTKKNFEFSHVSQSYLVNPNIPSHANDSPGSPRETITELEDNTLKLFRDAQIMPKIDKKVRLLLTGARPGQVHHSINKAARCISSGEVPEYFAITRTSLNEISLILPGSARRRSAMGFDYTRIIGSALDTIVPISLDLTKLPLDATGIVAGLASRLFTSIKSVPEATGTFEMSYLSMARSAILMIPRENLYVVSKMIKAMKNSSIEDTNKYLSDLLL